MRERPTRTVTTARLGLLFLLLAPVAVAAEAVDLTRYRVVDLTSPRQVRRGVAPGAANEHRRQREQSLVAVGRVHFNRH